ncbi:MAG TPA: DNA polymerase IV [Gammaproteobacteria bacterium]|jgi:DNA polymerase-4|nr:DNA polymerase IV [Gammaproteobacteria bacterium]
MSEQTNDRRIAHLDMDAFFASVELLRRPALRGLPVVVGGRHVDGERLRSYAGRGVVTTATYEARAFGVRSGMGLMKAALLAPDAILLPANFDAYREYSRRFKAAVRAITPVIEDRGIDEIYIDLSAETDDAHTLGTRLKHAVHAATGLTCSIGIARNKLLAKLCSDLDKPDGLTVLGDADLATRIWPLPAARINGVGPKSAARLTLLGIDTIADLAAADPTQLIDEFGSSYGRWLHDAAHGRDQRPVVTAGEPRSVSRETTFERDLHPRADREQLGRIFTALCERLAEDLERKGYLGRTVGIKLRYDDFRTLTRDYTLPEPVASARELRHAAGQCLRRVALDRPMRLLGVRVSGLVSAREPLPISPQQTLDFGIADGDQPTSNRRK